MLDEGWEERGGVMDRETKKKRARRAIADRRARNLDFKAAFITANAKAMQPTTLQLASALFTPALCILYAYLIGAAAVLAAVTRRASHPSRGVIKKAPVHPWLVVAALCLAATWY